jgi:hypothetical protein
MRVLNVKVPRIGEFRGLSRIGKFFARDLLTVEEIGTDAVLSQTFQSDKRTLLIVLS